MGEVVLVAGNSLVERFTIGKTTEVEALSPAILVEVSGEVVVTRRNGYFVCSVGVERADLRGKYCLVRVAYSLRRAYAT